MCAGRSAADIDSVFAGNEWARTLSGGENRIKGEPATPSTPRNIEQGQRLAQTPAIRAIFFGFHEPSVGGRN
jgi:hypothetical protein